MKAFLMSCEAYLHSPTAEKCESLSQILNSLKASEEDIPALTTLVSSASHARLKLMAFLRLSLLNILPKELQMLWNIDEKQSQSLLDAELKQARFPIVDSQGKALMAELYICGFEEQTPRAISLLPQAQKAAQELANSCDCSFLICFSDDFEGDSWLCAALAALRSEHASKLKNLAFTGSVDRHRKLCQADQLEVKNKVAKEHGLRLISSLNSIQELDFLLNAKVLPLAVVQTSTDRSLANEWLSHMERAIKEQFPDFNLAATIQMGGIQAEDLLIFYEGKMPFEAELWKHFLRSQVKNRFDYLQSQFPAATLLFWYAGMISSLQFGIGVIFGFKRPICICHWDSSLQKYLPMIKLFGKTQARILKNVEIKTDELHYLSYETSQLKEQQATLAMIIYLGSHNPVAAAKQHAKTIYHTDSTLIISLKESQGQLQNQDDWLRVAREINSLLNQLKQKHHWQKLLIYQSAPAAVCMALGIALGHFVNAEIMHFQAANDPEYKAMYNLMEL